MVEELASVELVGWRARSGRFVSMNDDIIEDQRRMLSDHMDVLLYHAISDSPVQDDEHHSKEKSKYSNERHFADEWDVRMHRLDNGHEAFLENHSPYANLVLHPTAPHEITAHGKVLHLDPISRNGTEFAKSVWHPGTRGNDIGARLQEEFGGREVEEKLQTVAKKATQRFADIFS